MEEVLRQGDSDAWQVREDRRDAECRLRREVSDLRVEVVGLRKQHRRYGARGLLDTVVGMSILGASWYWGSLLSHAAVEPQEPLTRGPLTELGVGVVLGVLAVGIGGVRVVVFFDDLHHRLNDESAAKHDEIAVKRDELWTLWAQGFRADLRAAVARRPAASPPGPVGPTDGGMGDREAEIALWRTTQALADGARGSGSGVGGVYPFPAPRSRS